MSRFIILMYHMISDPVNTAEMRYACSPEQLEKHIKMLLETGYTLVNINQVSDFYTNNLTLPENAALITLDDGFEDNYLNAFPIFKRYKVPAVIYLATGLIGKTTHAIANSIFTERKMLSWSQINEMSKCGIEFGSHTVSHAKLNLLDDTEAYQELIDSKKKIEEILGKECTHFAYPYGLLTENTRNLVKKCGFKTACSTRSGFNNTHRDPLILHRIEVYGTDSVWKLKQKVLFGTNEVSLAYILNYYYSHFFNKVKEFIY
ncbi:MAG: polysaccharide deacetylase family protein [Methylomicrobium sp.]|nr:polysaccharide deacetylase family protein [Methylomicrobium sp.]